jgi:hypothetical protein
MCGAMFGHNHGVQAVSGIQTRIAGRYGFEFGPQPGAYRRYHLRRHAHCVGALIGRIAILIKIGSVKMAVTVDDNHQEYDRNRFASPGNGLTVPKEPAIGTIIRQRGSPDNGLRPLFRGTLGSRSPKVGTDPTGTNGIDQNIMAGCFRRQNPGQGIQRGFGDTVGGPAASHIG